MNILYTAFSIGKGMGGHFRSMKTIMEAISHFHNCYVMIFGQVQSPIFLDFNNTIFIDVKRNNYFEVRKRINYFLSSNNIELIHSFDEFSYMLCQLGKSTPKLLTRCGGPNPNRYPIVKYLTCFSKENFDYFYSKPKYKNSIIKLIPNRVTSFKCDLELIKELEKLIERKEGDFILLRITRIGIDYIKSIEQSINLLSEFKKYSQKRNNIKLIVLGAIYDQKLYTELLNNYSNVSNLYFITDIKFTKDAKKILDIADVVIGTGRGLMEASSKGKVLFAPVKNSKLPVLIKEDNFKKFFYYNFSQRAVIENPKINYYEDINTVLKNPECFSDFFKKSFNDFFNIENGISKYLTFYQKVVTERKNKLRIVQIGSYLLYIKYLMFKNKFD